jgi:2-amino-4-hydroxy-6-hydroxymethyldihydropteridine diphosphokinase
VTAGRSFTAVWLRTFRLTYLYLIGLGSNQSLPLVGRPHQILDQAIAALEMDDIDVFAQSATISSAPLGPSRRQYANAAAIVSTKLTPPELLRRLQHIEHHFGRTWRGQPWQARTLDLDIVLWSEGIWAESDPHLAIPHPALRNRNFVLTPAAMIAPDWRDPVTGLTIRQLQTRFNRPKRLDPAL